MPGDHLSLSQSSLAYAKLTATPTDSAWSQVYNAGNLFACLSLTLKEQNEQPPSLQTLGKELLSNLEAEFFTLEEKNLDTIKEALHKSTAHIPEGVSLNFCLAFFKNHILYLFLLGHGRVIMKRGDKLGTLIEHKEEEPSKLQTASGLLNNGDTIIIETNQFAKNVSDQHLTDALQLELPSDIAEALSLHMHEKTDGDQAAIIIVYHGKTPQLETTSPVSSPSEKEEPDDDDEEIIPAYLVKQQQQIRHNPPLFAKLSDLISRIHLPFSHQNRRIVMGGLTHRKKLFLSITLIICLLLVVSITFTKQKQEDTKTAALFASVYTPALKNYDEGVALASLNDELSQEDFRKAEQLLLEGQNKFSADSQEAKQIEELLTKIQNELNGTAKKETTPTPSLTNLDRKALTISVLNGSGVAGAAGDTADTLRTLGYTIEKVENAEEFDYEGLTIVITKEKEAYLDLLKKDLSDKNARIKTEINNTISVNAEVIVGK